MADAVNKGRLNSGLEIEFHRRYAAHQGARGHHYCRQKNPGKHIRDWRSGVVPPRQCSPEMGVFSSLPYLVKSYDQAYKIFNTGRSATAWIGSFQDKYKLRVLFAFTIMAFPHFLEQTARPIAAPKDLRGLKLRVGSRRRYSPTRSTVWAVSAVPMALGRGDPGGASKGVIRRRRFADRPTSLGAQKPTRSRNIAR